MGGKNTTKSVDNLTNTSLETLKRHKLALNRQKGIKPSEGKQLSLGVISAKPNLSISRIAILKGRAHKAVERVRLKKAVRRIAAFAFLKYIILKNDAASRYALRGAKDDENLFVSLGLQSPTPKSVQLNRMERIRENMIVQKPYHFMPISKTKNYSDWHWSLNAGGEMWKLFTTDFTRIIDATIKLGVKNNHDQDVYVVGRNTTDAHDRLYPPHPYENIQFVDNPPKTDVDAMKVRTEKFGFTQFMAGDVFMGTHLYGKASQNRWNNTSISYPYKQGFADKKEEIQKENMNRAFMNEAIQKILAYPVSRSELSGGRHLLLRSTSRVDRREMFRWSDDG